MIIVCLLRLIGSTLILRYPLLGGFLAIALDYVDMRILEYFQHGDLSNYQSLDKLLDLYYLSLEAYIAYKWKNNLARFTALFLFIYRLIGTLIFEYTKIEPLLMVFPNLFEYFFMAYLLHLKFFRKDLFIKPMVIVYVMIILLLIKLPHEYLLHVNTTNPWSENKYIQMILNPDYIEKKAVEALDNVTP